MNEEGRLPANAVWSLLAALVLAGGFLRLWTLWDYALSPDEGIFVYTSSEATLLKVWRASMVNVHPPANFFLLHTLLKVSWNPTWLKMGALLCGTGAIVLIFLFCRELLGEIAGLAAAFLVAFSPNLIELSRVARNYSPGMAFLLAALYFAARFMKRGAWRDFYFFAAFELAAAFWHYSFVIVMLGANGALMLGALAERRPPAWWLRLIACQLPVAALFVWAFLVHIPRIDPRMVDAVQGYMTLEYKFTLGGFFHPVIQVYRYLLGRGWIGKGFAYFAVLSAALLASRGRWRELAFCALPIPIAYVFALAGKLPLGETRHSAHLYPCLIGLVAAGIAEIAQGLPALAERAKTAARYRSPLFQKSCAALVCLAGLAYASYAVRVYSRPMTFNITDQPHYKAESLRIPESPTRFKDLEIVRGALEKTGDEDLILVSYQALLILRSWLDPEPMSYDPDQPFEFEASGKRFYYSAKAYWYFTPESFLAALADTLERHPRNAWKRVYVPYVGWEVWSKRMHDHLKDEFPELEVESDVTRGTGGLVFKMEIANATELKRQMDARGARP